MTFKKGDIVECEDKKKRKVLSVNDDGLVCISWADDFDSVTGWYTQTELVRLDVTLAEPAPWKPELGTKYWCVGSSGEKYTSFWSNSKIENYRLSIGNCCETEADLDKYIEKLKSLGK